MTAVGLERLLLAPRLDEARMKNILETWEAQLAATEGQTADESLPQRSVLGRHQSVVDRSPVKIHRSSHG